MLVRIVFAELFRAQPTEIRIALGAVHLVASFVLLYAHGALWTRFAVRLKPFLVKEPLHEHLSMFLPSELPADFGSCFSFTLLPLFDDSCFVALFPFAPGYSVKRLLAENAKRELAVGAFSQISFSGN